MKNMMRTDCDCMRCCIAEFLDMNYEEVPNFIDPSNKHDSSFYKRTLHQFLYNKGFGLLTIYVTKEHFPIDLTLSTKVIAGLHKKDRLHGHSALLYLDTEQDGRIRATLDDPKPNSEYTIEDIEAVDIVIPLYHVIINHN